MSPTEDNDFTETQLSSRVVYEGALLKVVEDRVRLPDGKESVREYVRHPGACMMIAFLDEQTILLERQFRYPLHRHFIELPAGKIEHGEDPLLTAKRELREECGYEAAEWRHIATLHPCIGYADEHIELYVARNLTYVGDALDDGEFLEVFPLTIAEALEWVRDGRITEAKAVTGLLWADKIQRGEWLAAPSGARQSTDTPRPR
jgi:ADP-ribose pyrophosphatase